jgi:hypothetical protein
MTQDEAEAFLQQYRNALKQWSMVVGGFAAGNSETLYEFITKGRPTLDEISRSFPVLSYSAEMLKGSTDKTSEWFLDHRPVRPAGRETR